MENDPTIELACEMCGSIHRELESMKYQINRFTGKSHFNEYLRFCTVCRKQRVEESFRHINEIIEILSNGDK